MLKTILLLAAFQMGYASDPLINESDVTYKLAKAEFKKDSFKSEDVKKRPHTIQVAAYLSETQAIEHVASLKKTEKNAFYYSTYVRGQVWYKVCVGRFKTIEEATKSQQAFIKKHDEPFSVVISLDKLQTVAEADSGSRALDSKLTVADTRSPASVAVKPKLEINKEAEALPVIQEKSVENAKEDTAKISAEKEVKVASKETQEVAVENKMESAKDMSVTLIPKKSAGMKAEPKNQIESSNRYYALQVAAFNKREEAETALSKYTGLSGQVVEATVDGKIWYRVLVGNFKSHKEADSFRAQFKTEHNVDGFIRKIQ